MNTKFVVLFLGVLGLAAGQTENPITPTPDPSFKCPTEEGFYSHPKDCAAFYECSGFNAWLLRCDGELLWNQAIEMCDWPQNVNCNSSAQAAAVVRKQPKGQEIIGPGDYNCTENGAFPHEELCEYYYDCWEGYASLGRCTEGYLFDLTYMGCNYPNSVDCGDRIRPNGTTNPTTTSTTTKRTTTTRLPGTGSTEPGGEFVCPDEFGLYPNPVDCYTFYQCAEYVAFLNECPAPLVFNPELSICDHKVNVPSCKDA